MTNVSAMQTAGMPAVNKVGKEQTAEFTAILQKYKAGKANLENRIIASENWWKLRNAMEEEKTTAQQDGFRSTSGWLHNVIVSKHADAMDSMPAPTILPREAGDKQEAKTLSSIIPCVLEQNHFEDTYSDAMWQKLKTGTGAYKIVWDKQKLGGMGDIGIERVNLLNLFWEPGVTDIQDSQHFFHTELVSKAVIERENPEIAEKLRSNNFTAAKFLYDDHVPTDDKYTVIEVYYHDAGGLLQYCKYVGDQVLYASENDPEMAARGLYDHKKYPFVFDTLFPIEGSPCGYGYIDLCRNPQTEIDLMKTAFVKNTMAGATPRYFVRSDGSVNLDEFLDLTRSIVHVDGNLGEDSLRQINFSPMPSIYEQSMLNTIQELRETSGNTETSTGSTSSGVTAASAIAALQEASGKGSRDSTRTSYRAYCRIMEFCIELIRQFYDMPRQFRITGQMGQDQFVSYSNQGIRPQQQGMAFGVDLGYRLPTFDIKVAAQKKSAYTTLANNEMAIQFFQMGFFNPQMTDQALMCMDLMEFDGKEDLMQKISQNGMMADTLQLLQQYAVNLAAKYGDQMALGQLQAIMQQTAAANPQMAMSAAQTPVQQEPTHVKNARDQAQAAPQPDAVKDGKGAAV